MSEQKTHQNAKPQEIVSETLMQTSQAWNGTPYTAYPGGKPQLTVMKMHIPAHSALPWHSHSMPNIAYILSGKLTIEDKEGSAWKTENIHVKPIYLQGLHAVKALAGESYHMTVTYPDDEEFELLSDPYVFQHVVKTLSPL